MHACVHAEGECLSYCGKKELKAGRFIIQPGNLFKNLCILVEN